MTLRRTGSSVVALRAMGARAEGTCLVGASGACEIDLARRELRVLGSPAPLGGRAFEIVAALAQSAGQLVTKDELMRRIWPGAIVMDGTLHVHAAAIRKALGPYRALLKTESRRGYRLLGDWTVRRRDLEKAPASLPEARIGETAPPTNFPATVTRLVGRSAAVRKLQDLVSAYRVVTLTGPGGIGKTTLALEVARRVLGEFADGGWWIELASLSDPHLVPSTVAGALGLGLGPDISSAEAVARAVGGKQLLLVLDNCEHLIDAAATLAEMFVRLCPRVTVLATSRELFRIGGEYAYRVPPLGVPAAGQVKPGQILGCSAPELFIARAKELGSECSGRPESLPTVAAICRHLDGIPLAIEFAAARSAALGIEQVAAGLRDRFALLTSGRRTALPRHRTLRATFDWSYHLLPPQEQLLLRWVSVFPAGFLLIGAIEVLAGQLAKDSVIDGISSLVEKSLLSVDETAVAVYRMLETTREYAYGRLAESGEGDAAMQRHALYVRSAISRAKPAIRHAEEKPLNDSLVPRVEEIHNVRSALDWCFSPHGDAQIGVEITAAYALAWLHLSLMAECRMRIESALDHLDPASALTSELAMQLYIALAIATIHTSGLVEDTQPLLQEAMKIADSTTDDNTHLRALWAIWDYHSNSREYGQALSAARRFYQKVGQSDSKPAMVVANRLLGHSLHYHGEQAQARFHLEQVLELDTGCAHTVWFQYDQRVLAGAILARVLWLLGYSDKAVATAEACCAEAAVKRHSLSQCYAHALAVFPLMCWTGNIQAAQKAADACMQIACENNLSFYRNWSQCLQGVLLVEQGDFRTGTEVLLSTLPVLGRVGNRQPEFQIVLARGLCSTGDHVGALRVLDAALAHAESNGEYWCVPELLRIRSEVLIAMDVNGDDTVERQLQRALSLACEQGARSWELRTMTSLAQHRRRHGGHQPSGRGR